MPSSVINDIQFSRLARRSVLLITIVSLLLGVTFLPATGQEQSSLGMKVQLGFNVPTSGDQWLRTDAYPTIDDDPTIFDAENWMNYNFDYDTGVQGYGALLIRANKTVTFEMGAGYKTIPLVIEQNTAFAYNNNLDQRVWERYYYPTEEGASMNYFELTALLNIHLPVGSRTASPYISLGPTVLFGSVEGENVFSFPYVSEDATAYYLEAGEYADYAYFVFDESYTSFGVTVGGGLEFQTSEFVSFDIGFKQLIVFNDVLEDFADTYKDRNYADLLNLIGYDFQGLKPSNFSVYAGFVFAFPE